MLAMSHELQKVLTSPAIIPDFRAKRTDIQSQIALALDCLFLHWIVSIQKEAFKQVKYRILQARGRRKWTNNSAF